MTRNIPLISVVIPVRNEGERIEKTILSFINGRSYLFPLEFIIVDDASADGCCDNIESTLSNPLLLVEIKKVRLSTWSGIPFARNIGAKNATAPVLVITDANVIACNLWDQPVFNNITPNTALCATIADMASNWKGYGCVLHLPSMGIQWLANDKLFNGFAPIMPCTGTVIYAELFNKLGGYDTAMPVYGAAEAEFSVRLWLYGAKIKNVPELVFFHRFRPKEERQPFLDQIGLIQAKNYIRFGLLYLDAPLSNDLLIYWKENNPDIFENALSAIDMTEIWNRRNYLQQSLKNNFDWYCGNFKLNEIYSTAS